jgi:plasmid stabilization system protein ParE
LVLHPHYLAVYRVRGEEVHILTVLHTARQWP